MNILENELECKLFVRSNRGVTLTPEGEKLFQHVAIAYEQLSTAESELKKDKSLESGLITIGASTDKKLGLEGEDAKGVISAVQFLRMSDTEHRKAWKEKKLP